MIENYIPSGYENRVSRLQLKIMSGLPDRLIRDQIAEAQERGVMIASVSGGYFQYRDERDDPYYRSYLKQERSRSQTLSKKNRALMRSWNALHPRKEGKNDWPGQMSLFGGRTDEVCVL